MIQLILKDGTVYKELTEEEVELARANMKLPREVSGPAVACKTSEIRFVRQSHNRYVEVDND